MRQFRKIKTHAIAAHAEQMIELDTNEIDAVVTVHMSASGQAKYEVFRNEELVATLFSGSGQAPKQAELNLPFPVAYGKDRVYVKFYNYDRCAQDMYASVQTYTEPRVRINA